MNKRYEEHGRKVKIKSIEIHQKEANKHREDKKKEEQEKKK